MRRDAANDTCYLHDTIKATQVRGACMCVGIRTVALLRRLGRHRQGEYRKNVPASAPDSRS